MNTLQEAIYGLVEKFVQRQTVPYEVIRKYRPNLIDSSKPRSTSKAYLSATQIGFWGESNEWEYRLHGGGCHVTHVDTREVIDWDAPNLQHFNPDWLADWVRWYVKNNTQDEAALLLSAMLNKPEEDYRRSIFEILDQLYRLGKLNYYPDRLDKYELISKNQTGIDP